MTKLWLLVERLGQSEWKFSMLTGKTMVPAPGAITEDMTVLEVLEKIDELFGPGLSPHSSMSSKYRVEGGPPLGTVIARIAGPPLGGVWPPEKTLGSIFSLSQSPPRTVSTYHASADKQGPFGTKQAFQNKLPSVALQQNICATETGTPEKIGLKKERVDFLAGLQGKTTTRVLGASECLEQCALLPNCLPPAPFATDAIHFY